MEWLIGSRKMLLRKHLLVVEIVRRRTMEAVRAGFRRKLRDDSRGTAMFARKCVDLNAGLLNRVRSRCQIQDSLTDAAGYIEAVNDVLIVVGALAVGAGI